MRIGIGLNLFTPDAGGVANYVVTLLRHWPEFAPNHQMVLFTFDHNEAMLSQLPPESRRHEIRIQTQEDMLQHLDKIDVYFCPFNTLWPRPIPLPSVITFTDMQERFYPQFFTAKQLEERFHHYDWSLRMADVVIAISDFTKRSCTDIVGISARKVQTIHLSPDDLPPPREPAGWQSAGWEKFLYYPANFWDHKNHLNLLGALGQLRANGQTVRCVFTGSVFGREAEWDAAVVETGTADLVRHLGRRPRAELSWLFRNTRGLIVPSLFEGFGIPVVEAMHCGCPVACSGGTSLPEVAGDSALYFDPRDVKAIAHAAARLWNDDALCADLVSRGHCRGAGFNARKLVEAHVAAFALARRRYNPLKHWYRRRFLLPASAQPRTALRPDEIATAHRLLEKLDVMGGAS
jgi:glycosyltransferase involved in cell wall biosynthesis